MSAPAPGVFDALAATPGNADPVDARIVADFAARLAAYSNGNPLDALLRDFRAAGFGRDVDAWLAPGQSAAPALPRDAITDVIAPEHVIDEAWIEDTCKRNGLDRIALLSRLSGIVPWAIKTLTPRGEVPSPRGLEMGLEVLRRRATR